MTGLAIAHMAESGMLDVVAPLPGRECGDCTLCCRVLLVDTPQMQKQAGVNCRYCAGGCTVHDSRPPVCRDFHCAWRQLDMLGPEWRPDLSGVFAQIETEDLPPDSGFAAGIGLMLVGNPLKTIRQKFVIDFVATGLEAGIPLFLSLPGPPGHQAAKTLLNGAVPGKAEGVKALLEAALKDLRAHPFRAHAMVHGGNSVEVC